MFSDRMNGPFKCARFNTIFHYNSMTGGDETHKRFWKGRQFEVLLLPEKTYKDAKWVKGEVVKWTEWNSKCPRLCVSLLHTALTPLAY